MAEYKDTLLEFPCRFPIKAMGKQDGEFEALVTRIVKPKSPEADCPAAKAAIRKELDSMREKRVLGCR